VGKNLVELNLLEDLADREPVLSTIPSEARNSLTNHGREQSECSAGGTSGLEKGLVRKRF
jgi:hypothetical protein